MYFAPIISQSLDILHQSQRSGIVFLQMMSWKDIDQKFYLTRYELKLKTQVDAQLGSVMVKTFF